MAKSNFPGQKRPLALSPADLTKHLHIIGEIGTGKSTLNENLLQHIDAGGLRGHSGTAVSGVRVLGLRRVVVSGGS